MRRRLFVVACVCSLLVASAIAFASIGTPDVIVGCVDDTGDLRIPRDGTCQAGEQRMTWNHEVPASTPNSDTSCPDGEFVVGFDTGGSMLCAPISATSAEGLL